MKELLRSAWAVLQKDMLLEVRTRYGLNTIALFVLISVALALFSLAGEVLQREVLAALFWNTV
ncbi:MAG: heme ABC transporter permease CcmB, partial [Candidatus Thermochlorobacter sp.]